VESAERVSHSVLLLETDAVQRDLLRITLERGGYDVVSTGDPRKAEVLLQSRAFHCVVMEILLPGINGLRFIRKIRHDDSLHQPHFILMSSLGFREVVEQVASLKVSGFLKKPIDPSDLLDRLDDLI
jgi:CheY-like chemotaxis protein